MLWFNNERWFDVKVWVFSSVFDVSGIRQRLGPHTHRKPSFVSLEKSLEFSRCVVQWVEFQPITEHGCYFTVVLSVNSVVNGFVCVWRGVKFDLFLLSFLVPVPSGGGGGEWGVSSSHIPEFHAGLCSGVHSCARLVWLSVFVAGGNTHTRVSVKCTNMNINHTHTFSSPESSVCVMSEDHHALLTSRWKWRRSWAVAVSQSPTQNGANLPAIVPDHSSPSYISWKFNYSLWFVRLCKTCASTEECCCCCLACLCVCVLSLKLVRHCD